MLYINLQHHNIDMRNCVNMIRVYVRRSSLDIDSIHSDSDAIHSDRYGNLQWQCDTFHRRYVTLIFMLMIVIMWRCRYSITIDVIHGDINFDASYIIKSSVQWA